MAAAQYGANPEREGPGDPHPVYVQRHHGSQTAHRGRKRAR